MPPLGTLHTAAHVEAVTVVTTFPQVPDGQIKLLTTWTDWVPVEGVVLPFKLQAGDFILAVATPTQARDDYLGFTGLSLSTADGYPLTRIEAGANAYRVVECHDMVTLKPEHWASWVHAGSIMVALLIYRGVQTFVRNQTEFTWDVSGTQLGAQQRPIYYSAPAAEIARVTYAELYPELPPFSYSPDYGYEGYTVTEPAEGYEANPDWQVTVEINSGQDLSPTDATDVYANGGWDAKYQNGGWGKATFYTFIFSTQAVDFVPVDPDNPAPVGGAHVPIEIVPSNEEGSGIVDEEGDQLVDENDDTLIWS